MVEVSDGDGSPSRGPVRLCIGCRERAGRSVLLRVVAAEVGGVWSAVPDPDRRQPGRGASLHPTPSCLALAERRRAFTRALRSGVPLESAPVRAYLQEVHDQHHQNENEPSTESGSDADEHSMSDRR